jgi:hypothetical protein
MESDKVSVSTRYVLLFDIELKASACVLLQAAFGCGAHPAALRHFSSRHWLTSLTPGMRKITGTESDWKRAAEITTATWGDRRPNG